MREIKFRAWHKEWKQLAPIDAIYFWVGGEKIAHNFKAPKFSVNDEFEIELMQFTGLYDKNGCPIYEGDIIKIIWGDGNPATVEKALLVAWNDRRLGFAPFVSLCEDIDISEFKFEVIGNIFENPELIEETK